MANENSIDVYHALMALEEKVKGVAPDPENVTTDVALALADIFRTDVPMAQETAIVNAIDTVTANYGGGGVDVGNIVSVAAPNAETDTIIATLGDKQMLITDCVNADGIAAGMTVEITTHLAPPFTHGVTASYEQPDGTEGEFTDFTYTEVDATTGRITFVVPNLPIDDTDPSDIIYSTLSFWSAD